MIDFLAPLFGRRVVFLQDFDGKVAKRWAKPTPFGLVCNRFALSGDHDTECLLLPNGAVRGPSWVDRWAFPTPTEAADRSSDDEVTLLRQMLGECYVLAGADTNGDDPARHYRSAVEAVRELREDYDQALTELPQEGYTLRLRLALEHIARVGKGSKSPSKRLTWIIDRAISAIDDDHSWKSTRKPKNYHDALELSHARQHTPSRPHPAAPE